MPDIRDNKISCSNYQCEIEVTLEVLSGKWKSLILWNLHLHEKIRYNELRRLITGITQKMLTQQLRDLEKYGIVERMIYPTVPPMVEYSLTQLGKDLIPIMQKMDEWGKEYVKHYQAQIETGKHNA
ncbi:HxlR family transcriptional regulator [Actinobacillus delphinicola]|uniref:HxlR family transcriptional regulator n=1 Tax=Actinobacillus delphinicola TaxID=51161 RepID=A0A448TS58_9PAST|nr:helix-turn-helix domain-containing protein [Actinobacillus delphinicola]MDG6897006.1 HxlR family transcriptional regulator [Actinobacillus delphinicola]VEJ08822.1 HxlR family transcriptional regulator [Actinobacillus delphinicola]